MRVGLLFLHGFNKSALSAGRGAKELRHPASAFGRSLPVMPTNRIGQIRCNRWSEPMQVAGQVECKRMVK
jgi:hypothetical protein